ncbi:MAG TPA: type II secretion system F family protein [Sphingomicrobium sp.]
MSEVWIRAVILVCTFGAVALLVEALVSWAAHSRAVSNAINARMRMIAEGRTRGETLNLLRRQTSDIAGMLPAPLAPLGVKLERLLIAARLRAPTSRVLILLGVAPLALFLAIVFAIQASGGVMSAGRILLLVVFSITLGLGLPLMAIQVKANRTRRKMQEQFPVALDVFVRGLRAGHPIAAALDLLTVEMSDPIGSEFGIVVDEVTYGADLRDALQAMADRWNMEDMRMFVVSLAVQMETGGNLAEILENLAQVIRERASMMMKVRALSSEGRMTSIMLTVLPLLAFTMLFIVNPQFYLDVADDPAFVPGFVALLLLYAIGFIAIRRMVDLKV